MTDQALFTLIVLIVTTIFFLFNILPLGLVAMMSAVALAIGGVLKPAQAFSPLANTTSVLIMAMIILGHALFHTGVASKISRGMVRLTGKSENGIMIAVVIVALALSSICSGVAVVAVLLPIVIGLCQEAGVSISRQLIPLSFAASVGCNLTLVGAASNVITAGIIEDAKINFLGFWELGKVGLPLCVLFLVYFLTIGKKLIRQGDTSDPEFIAVMTKKHNGGEITFDPLHGAITVIVLLCVIAAMTVNSKKFPMYFVAAIGVIVLRVTNCLDEKEFYRAFGRSTLFIVGGMTALAMGVRSSGLGAYIANSVVAALGTAPSKIAFLAAVLITTCILTNIMSNTGTAGLVTPIFIPIAQSLGVNPVAVGVAICVAASMPFLTPYGSGTNTLLIQPGRLTVRDFFVPGIGLTFVILAGSLVFIPLFFTL